MADDYYAKMASAKASAREEDTGERYGQTAASTPTDSKRFPTQRYSVMGGTVSADPNKFQSNSALIRDASGGAAKGYAIGDTLPDGSNIQDIVTGRDGSVQVSVILPDGRETVLGSRQPKAQPAAPVAGRRDVLRQVMSSSPSGLTLPPTNTASMKQYMEAAGMNETYDVGEDDEDNGDGTKTMRYNPRLFDKLDAMIEEPNVYVPRAQRTR